MLLMQTAFADLYSPNLDATTGNPTVWNLHNLDAAAWNPPALNLPDSNTATGEPVILSTDTNKAKTINTMSGSIPPSDLINSLSPLQISYV
jgi:hypothetical protein